MTAKLLWFFFNTSTSSHLSYYCNNIITIIHIKNVWISLSFSNQQKYSHKTLKIEHITFDKKYMIYVVTANILTSLETIIQFRFFDVWLDGTSAKVTVTYYVRRNVVRVRAFTNPSGFQHNVRFDSICRESNMSCKWTHGTTVSGKLMWITTQRTWKHTMWNNN